MMDFDFQSKRVNYLDIFQGISENGVRAGDVLDVKPFVGKKYEICLNWTKIEIISALGEGDDTWRDLGQNMGQIVLPQLKGEFPFSYQLELVKGNRYMIKALSIYPFKINNQISYLSFLERGDKVLIGANMLCFFKKKEEGDKKIEPTLDKELLDNDVLMKSDLSLLLEGETGTGKSHLAKLIHEKSGRAGPFIQVNLQSFSLNLLESELFGHKKGSFTGASFDKIGAIRSAHEGTLFLDELDSLPLEIQTKLLLFLDSKRVRPLGADKEEKASVRLIFATATAPEKLVVENRMRKDFYFRILGGHRYKLNALREDPRKIYYLSRMLEEKYDVIISSELEKFYLGLSWPGNVRQFISHIKKKVILGNNRRLSYDQLDEGLLLPILGFIQEDKIQYPCLQEGVEQMKMLKRALRIFHEQDGNLSKTSKILNINRQKLKRMILPN